MKNDLNFFFSLLDCVDDFYLLNLILVLGSM